MHKPEMLIRSLELATNWYAILLKTILMFWSNYSYYEFLSLFFDKQRILEKNIKKQKEFFFQLSFEKHGPCGR